MHVPPQTPEVPRRDRTPAPSSGARTETLARHAVERLSDDERLRGDLTDDSFGPLLAWLSRLLVGLARRSGPDPVATAMLDAAVASARALVAAVDTAAHTGDVASVAAALSPDLFTAAQRARARAALPRDLSACPSHDERARRLVAALASSSPGARS